jgi:hypothetical protein
VSDWIEDKTEIRDFPMDFRFKRKVFTLGIFSFMESIRVVQYPEEPKPCLIYMRKVGLNYMMAPGVKWPPKYILLIHQFMNFFYEKYVRDYDLTKWKEKYTFVMNLFKDEVRNEKLESLGIF